MARSRATIHTDIWNPTGNFRELTHAAQRLYFLMLTQGSLSTCGVAALTVARWAQLARDTDAQNITNALNELVSYQYVVVDEDTQEVWIRTFTKHDGVLKQPNAIVAMSRDFAAIQSITIRQSFMEGLPDDCLQGLPKDYPDRIDHIFLHIWAEVKNRDPFRGGNSNSNSSSNSKRSKKETSVPEVFEITPHLKEWATKNGFDKMNLEGETEKFLDHHASRDNKFANWDRAWQRWIRQAADWGTGGKAKGVDPRGKLIVDEFGDRRWSTR